MTTTEERAAGPAVAPDVPEGRGRRLLRGRPDDPRWSRPVLALLLVATAVTYLWDLGASGYANSFYAAAVQAGTQSPKAWLFGALDAPGLITVDKPPAAMWVMVLSGRIFGFSSWSMLVPQALMGVASVALLYATVRRWSGVRTALAAAAMLAFTPVAVLMFKFNNPDALLVLCMIGAAYATTRAIDAAGRRAGTGWIVAAGALVGLGFLTKLLQVLLVLPALALVYVLVADTPWRRRILDLAAAGVAIVVSAGWYVLLVELWPASSRPYIGGSTNNSLLELALGYNGLGRIVGGEGNGGGGGGGRGAPSGAAGGAPGGMPGAGTGGGPGGGGPGGGGGFGGTPSPWRMFNTQFAGQASWLLPAALLLLVAGLWFSRRVPRTDRPRGLLVLGGTWMLVHAIVFSAMSGTIHAYYTVALAPGIALTVAAGASLVWRHRAQLTARIVLAVSVLGTAAWSAVVLTTEDYASALRWVVLAAGVLGALGLLLVGRPRGTASGSAAEPRPGARRVGTLGVVTAVVALVGALGASTAYAAVTAVTPHTGSIVSAGASGGMGAGGPGGGTGDRAAGATGAGAPGAGATGTAPGAAAGGRGAGGMEGGTPSAALVTLLQQAGTRWAAATSGAQSSASLQLASDVPVMALGGFTGSDPAPTLAQFQAYVASGQVRYFVVGGGPGGGGGQSDRTGQAGQAPAGQAAAPQGGQGGPGGGSGDTSQISTWVAQHFTATQVGGRTVYDLSHPTS